MGRLLPVASVLLSIFATFVVVDGWGFGMFGGNTPPPVSNAAPPGFSGQMGDREYQVLEFLKNIEPVMTEKCRASNEATFQYETNVTDYLEDLSNKAAMDQSEYSKWIQTEITNRFPWWREVQCPKLWRQMRTYFLGGPGAVPSDKVEQSLKITSEMSAAYARAVICDFRDRAKCDLTLDPYLVDIMKNSRDYDETAYVFQAWHDAMSSAVSAGRYWEYIQLANELATANGYRDTGESTADAYNDFTPNWTFDQFKGEMAESWANLKPYFMKLHAFVRMKLRAFYGPKISHPLGYMPANILGNMWAQEWDNVEPIAKPFPEVPSLDATEALKAKGYDPLMMFQEADKFFQEMGLFPMNQLFWQNSIITKPNDGRDMLCHATAFELCTRTPMGTLGDYRIKMCTEVDQYNFGSIHHEMGHVQYYMHYAHQPFTFRDGANPGFHEAIGDALDLAVETPKHLQCALGLDMGAPIDCQAAMSGQGGFNSQPSNADLNLLFYKALNKLAMLPFAYSMETFKWEVASGALRPDQFNKRWWEIRKENQGIVTPWERPEGGFDPAAKYHIVADVEYIRYYWANILVFQFFQAMCVAAGEYDPNDPNSKPLYQCDFSGNKKAGRKLQKMMSKGRSIPWPDILEEFTGSRKLDPIPMINYLKPIFDYMDQQLQAAGEAPCFGPPPCQQNFNPPPEHPGGFGGGGQDFGGPPQNGGGGGQDFGGPPQNGGGGGQDFGGPPQYGGGGGTRPFGNRIGQGPPAVDYGGGGNPQDFGGPPQDQNYGGGPPQDQGPPPDYGGGPPQDQGGPPQY